MAQVRDISVQTLMDILPCLPKMKAKVLSFILNRGETGATMEEVGEGLDMRHNTYSPRVNELRRSGLVRVLIRDDGSSVLRRTSRGAMAEVYVAVTDPDERAELVAFESRLEMREAARTLIRVWEKLGGRGSWSKDRTILELSSSSTADPVVRVRFDFGGRIADFEVERS